MTISQRRCRVSPEKNSSRIAPIVASTYATSRIRVPITPELANTLKDGDSSRGRRSPSTTTSAAAAPTTTRAAAAGVRLGSRTRPSTGGTTPSRPSANSSRDAPTAQASAQPKALTEAPRLIRSPTQLPTYWPPRSPSSEPEEANACWPAWSVPKPMTSTQVTKMK